MPGFVEEVMSHTLQTAPYPERSLAFAYVTTRMGGHDRAEAVERALLEVLG